MPINSIPPDGWETLRPGVAVRWICRSENGTSSAFLRYDPGAEVPLHEHPGFEHIFVVEGSQGDEHGEYGPGSFVINSPGSVHAVHSSGGCTVLIVWTQPVRFL